MRSERWNLVLSWLLGFAAADGGNWLLTPMRHQHASDLQRRLVIAQTVVCGTAAVWIWNRYRRRLRDESPN